MTPGAQVVDPFRDPHQLQCVSNSVHDAPAR
jgi:hypothetical protein